MFRMTQMFAVSLFAVGLLFPLGCLLDLDDVTPSGTTGDEDEGVLGLQHCIQAEGAYGRHIDPPNLAVYIVDSVDSSPMRACKCYCPEDASVLSLGAAGAPLTTSQQLWYDTEVAVLKNLAAAACWEQVSVLGNIEFPAGFTDCDAAVADEDPYQYGDCPQDPDSCDIDVYIEGTSGGAGGGASLYGLAKFSDAVDCGSSTQCDVDPEFVEYLLSDLTIFEKDFVGVSISESRLGHRGFHFRQVGADSLPAAAGFGVGDIVWEANGLPLNSMSALSQAFEALHQSDEIVLEVDNMTTRRSMTFTLVDLASYP